jgi:hypothetical protein
MTRRVKPACPPYAGKRTHVEVYEFWPSDLQQVFAQAGIPRRKPPQNPDCKNAGEPDGDPPQITSPLLGSTYAMRLKQLGEERIAFIATTDADATRCTGSSTTPISAAACLASHCSGSRRQRAVTTCAWSTIMAAAISDLWA